MKSINRYFAIAITVMLIAPLSSFGQIALKTETRQGSMLKLSNKELQELSKSIFLWGIHPIAVYHYRYNLAQKESSKYYAGINRMAWSKSPIRASEKGGTTPNASTMYGRMVIDLSEEPMVIIAPEIKDRYWSLQACDYIPEWWFLMGSQFNKPGVNKRLVMGPDYKGHIPKEFYAAELVYAPSDVNIMIGRIAIMNEGDEEFEVLGNIADQFTIVPLSVWEANGKKPVKSDDLPVTRGNYPVLDDMDRFEMVNQIKGVDFLRFMDLFVQDDSFTKYDNNYDQRMALENLKKIGIEKGKKFDYTKFTLEQVKAIEAGVDEGIKEALAFVQKQNPLDMNTWSVITSKPHITNVERAGYALLALLSPTPLQSHAGAWGNVDSDRKPLDGHNKYTITFDLNNLPPVSEFWEIPVYDLEGYFYDNPINRYSVTSYMLNNGSLYTENGKLVLYIQHEAPSDPNQKKNWIPVPKSGFRFAARFYGQGGSIIDASYNMPAVVKVE